MLNEVKHPIQNLLVIFSTVARNDKKKCHSEQTEESLDSSATPQNDAINLYLNIRDEFI